LKITLVILISFILASIIGTAGESFAESVKKNAIESYVAEVFTKDQISTMSKQELHQASLETVNSSRLDLAKEKHSKQGTHLISASLAVQLLLLVSLAYGTGRVVTRIIQNQVQR